LTLLKAFHGNIASVLDVDAVALYVPSVVVREVDDIVGGNLSMTGAGSVTFTVKLSEEVPRMLLAEMISE
jgi:hypothetical protein